MSGPVPCGLFVIGLWHRRGRDQITVVISPTPYLPIALGHVSDWFIVWAEVGILKDRGDHVVKWVYLFNEFVIFMAD